MNKILGEKKREEIPVNELMAFTIAKLAPCEQMRYKMFHEGNIYNSPPVFVWRFNTEVEDLNELYLKLGQCVKNFDGNLQWEMYRDIRPDGRPYKNYVIEPIFIHEIKQSHNWSNISKILESDYKEQIDKAVKDVRSLCGHIEKTFNVSDAKPFLPILPFEIRNAIDKSKNRS